MKIEAVLDEQQKNRLLEYGYEVVDEKQIGKYDLVLTHFPLLDMYNLALQKHGLDVTNPDYQQGKFPSSIDADMTQAIPIINDWINKYGELWISSNNPEKTPVYNKILTRLGYAPEISEVMGIPISVIDHVSTRKISSKLLKLNLI